jgi:serine/alanine adding enzyme
MDVQLITTGELDEWAKFVTHSPTATGFHAPGWRTVLSEAFAVKPLFLRARDAGRVVGVLPLFRSSSLFFGDFISSLEDGHCGADAVVAHALGQGALNIMVQEGCGCLIYKTNFVTSAYPSVARGVQTVKTVVSTSRSIDSMFASLDKKTRWGVRNACRQGYRVRAANERLLSFYRIYADNLHQLGTPVFGPSVFEAMRRHLGASFTFYALERGDILVGGMVCLKAAHEWTSLYAAVEDEAQRKYAGYQLYWAVIEEAAKSGVARFNLGRSIPGSGVHRFKHKWTDEDVLATHYLFGHTSKRAAKRLEMATTRMGLARRLWTKIPGPIVSSAGRYLRRSLPFV